VSRRIVLQWIVEKYDDKAWIGLLWLKTGSAGGRNTHPEIWSCFSATVSLTKKKGEDFKQRGQEIPGDLVQYPETERERKRQRETASQRERTTQLIQNKRKWLSCLHSLPACAWLYLTASFLSADKQETKTKTESTWFLETYSLSSKGQGRKVRLTTNCLMAHQPHIYSADTTPSNRTLPGMMMFRLSRSDVARVRQPAVIREC
jgi:hypothetical protein